MPAKLVVINSGAAAELLEKALIQCVAAEIEQINNDLAIARRFWRQHRGLVESEEYPEPYRSFEIEQNDDVPDEYASQGWPNAGLSVEQLRAKLLPQAEEMAALRWKYRHVRHEGDYATR
jgi:hypothetical protein